MIPFEVDFKTLKTVRDVREAYDLINKSHPFAIRFTPYISQTELIDYIRSIFKQDIEPVLKKARDPGIKIGKRRSRVHGDRDKFISERLNTKRRDVQDMVNKKFHQQVSLKYISVIRKRVKDNNK